MIMIVLDIVLIDLQGSLLYANGCLEFKNYLECIETCDNILKTKEKQGSQVMMQTKILKGKARFYAYKKKFNHILANNNLRVTKEGNSILSECFRDMKEAIALLGNCLDQNMLDIEGSSLLDWAMIDCISITNQLDSCKRCLLCRRKKPLRKSHVWPNFVLQSSVESPRDKSCVFGLDKYQVKSAGACIYNMLCYECEERLSQNGEHDFQTKFQLACGEINYSSWLFSFCTGVLFRCMSTAVTFPVHFNDNEIYRVFCECRKHLLSLPVTINNVVVTLSDHERKQLEELNHGLNGKLDMFLFISPHKTQQDFGVIQSAYPRAAVTLSRNVQLNKRQAWFKGHAHFLLLCCHPITLIVPFQNGESSCVLQNKGFHLTSDPLESDQKYTIPSENECVALLPEGVWTVIEQLAEHSLANYSNVFRFTSSGAEIPNIQPAPEADTTIAVEDHNIKPEFNFLPRGYEIIKPFTRLSHSQRVMLPEGHHVILHSTLTVPSQNTDFTLLLCIDEPKSTPVDEYLYLIFVAKNEKFHFLYVDGVAVEVKDNKLTLTDFLQENKIANMMRYDLPGLQRILNGVIPNKHFDNIDLMVHLVNYRRYVV